MSNSVTPSDYFDHTNTARQHLVLVGGGHAHLQVTKALNHASRPKHLDVTLIDMSETPTYSGMVPGAIAGLYQPNETLIELKPLADWAGVNFVHGRVVDIDVNSKEIRLEQQKQQEAATIPFDVISIDIGSVSRDLEEVQGAKVFTIPTRPISDLVKRIEVETKELEQRQGKEQQFVNVVIVGAGAAGVELSMSIWGRWAPIVGNDQIQVNVLDAGDQLFPMESDANHALRQRLEERNIFVRHSIKVDRVECDHLILRSSERVLFTHCLWATGAGPAALAWTLQHHGLSVNEHGWIRVNQYLQSFSHPCVFAAGDCSCMEIPNSPPPPKAGVFAVRAGPVLIDNLTGYLKACEMGESASSFLRSYNPQGDFMKLMGCGDGKALGFRFGIPIYGKWVFDMKNAIDKSFMKLFMRENLPILENGQPYDTSQYDAILERPAPMDPADAATLIQRWDDDVDYHRAWNVIRDMADDDCYLAAVLQRMNIYKPEAGNVSLSHSGLESVKD